MPSATLPSSARFARRHHGAIVVALHAGAAAVAMLAAYALRFDLALPAEERARLPVVVGAVVVLRVLAMQVTGAAHGSWRHVSIAELARTLRATLLGSAAIVTLLFFLGHLTDGMPRSVLVLEAGLFWVLECGLRLAVRLRHERTAAHGRTRGRRTLVVGAGEGAERFLRQTMRDPAAGLHFVGIVDDDAMLRDRSIHGVRVLGGVDRLPGLVSALQAEFVVIAIPSASGEQMRRIVMLCEESGAEFRVMPSLRELLEGRATVGETRQVSLEDLLGRHPVHLDLGVVERDLAGATVLITGAAGSIGSELARQVAGFAPARLVLVEQAESPLYHVHLDLAREYPALDVVPEIGDVADRARMHAIMAAHRPSIVFHAAAYKHVPLMEAHPAEAVRNNALGSFHVAEAAVAVGARKCVLVSTDKAVYPSSVMGATKRLAELLFLYHPALAGRGTDFRAVRFGNVLGSAGSVVPLFREQLAKGGPLTVTHPEVRRYFMTIPEAVALVLQASALPDASGRILLLDMGKPVRIVDLAEQLIRLSGKVPYREIDIVFTGLRPGEKLDEELMSQVEVSERTPVEAIRLLRTDVVDGTALAAGFEALAAALAADRPALLAALRAVVPDYRPRPNEAAPQLVGGTDVEVPLPRAVDVPTGRRTPRPAVVDAIRPHLGPSGVPVPRTA